MEKYITCSNSASGFVNLSENNLEGISKVVSLSSASRNVVTKIIKRFAENIYGEIIVNNDDVNYCHGFIDRKNGFALMSDEVYDKGEKIEIANTNEFDLLFNKIKFLKELTYSAYKEAKEIHDNWEKLYIKEMDFPALDEYKKKTINKLINVKNKGTGKKYERFFGTSTVFGPVNYIEEITKDIKNRYFIKGRPGTGKSTFMKEVANKGIENGFDVLCYRCSFDPNSFDMVIIKELDFAVFDSTAPHEIFPSREGDSILDFYFESNLSGFDEKHKTELNNFNYEYKLRTGEGIEYLKIADKLYNEIESKIKTDNEEIECLINYLMRNIIDK